VTVSVINLYDLNKRVMLQRTGIFACFHLKLLVDMKYLYRFSKYPFANRFYCMQYSSSSTIFLHIYT